MLLDKHGQPVNSGFRAEGRKRRTVHELVGIAKAMVADGTINQLEADFLHQWLVENKRHALDAWPVNVINQRVHEMLSDGVIDEDERHALFDLLSKCIGGQPVAEHVASFSTALPFDDPLPDITFTDRTFCLTGCFAMGPRKNCHQQISDLGGLIYQNITQDLDYLIVGTIGSRDWLHSTHGTKIIKAVRYRSEGTGISIVSENHWQKFLPQDNT